MLKAEIEHKYKEISDLYGANLPAEDHGGQASKFKFTQSDHRRFCALFYVQMRSLLEAAELQMHCEGTKRMLPRHLLTAAVASGVIPKHFVSSSRGRLDADGLKNLEIMMNPKGRCARPKSEEPPMRLKK